MHRKFLIIIFVIFFSQNISAYNYEYKSEEGSINLKFIGTKISKIKFEFLKDKQKNFGIINYDNEVIDIILNTNTITFDEFKKFFPKPQKNDNLKKKD